MHAGPDAPLVLEQGLTSCHMEHVYDFYKPAGFFPKVSHLTHCMEHPDQPASCFVYIFCVDGVSVPFMSHSHTPTKPGGRGGWEG